MVRDAQELIARPLRRAVSDEDKAERRLDILAAAKRVFADKGYHATTIADIARAAGLSYGSIYWYYDSKESLFHELMAVEATALQEYIDDAVRQTPATPLGDAPFRAAVRATFEFYDADKALVKLLFRDAYALGERFEEHLFQIYEGFIAKTEAIVVAAQRKGVVVEGPSRMIAFSIAALVGQIAHRRLVDDDGLEPAVVADFIVSLLLNGLLPRPATSSRRAADRGS
jgi:AcrR family transcriptional regulator